MTSPVGRQALHRKLAEWCARHDIPIGDTTGPGQLALRHEPGLSVQRPHLAAIDQELTHLLATPNARVMIFTPPQVGKSTRVSRWFPFWWLTMRPRDRIILASYAASLAATHGAATRDLVAMHGARYGLTLSREASRKDWTLTTGGGMRARGVRGGLTGQSMDLGIIDDPFADRAAAESPIIRAAVWAWYSSTFSTRRSPHAREVLVMTRWHQDDLAGRLLDRDGRVEDGGTWRVLHLPALALTADPARHIGPDPLGRAPGEPLSHPTLPDGDTVKLLEHWARQRISATARDWNSMYQGVPFDAEAALLTDSELRAAVATPPTGWRRRAVGVDPSGGGRDTAGIIAGGLDEAGRVWWTHDRTARMPSDRWSRAACLLARETDADRIIVETNYGGDMGTTLVAQAWAALQHEGAIPADALCPLVVAVTARRSKVLRAEPIAQAVKTDRVRMAPGLLQLSTEWQMWEPGSTWSPGALDAAVYVATALLPAIPRGGRITSPAGVRRDSVTPAAGGTAARRR